LSDTTVLEPAAAVAASPGGPAAAAKPGQPAPLVLRPSSGWSALQLREVWHFRDLLFTLAGRDLKLRYKQTALGAIWVVLQPLATAGIFTFVFGVVAGMKTSFALSLAGTMGWTLFSNTLGKTSNCLVGNAHLISKVFFPRLILPLSSIPSAMVDFAVGMVMLIGLLVFQHQPHYPSLLGIALLPVWIILLLMLSMGVGLIAASLTVTYRDVAYVLPVVTQLLMYGSPVGYSAESVAEKAPHWMQTIFFLNPLSPLLEGFKWSLLGEGEMKWNFVLYGAAVSLAFMVLGAFSFKRMERRFADVI
jgi:lipopolysaccharide transport system permease protein